MTTPKKTMEETLAEMDAEAKRARVEFELMGSEGELDKDTMISLKGWWERWYLTAGHKRLAYILMGKKLNGE